MTHPAYRPLSTSSARILTDRRIVIVQFRHSSALLHLNRSSSHRPCSSALRHAAHEKRPVVLTFARRRPYKLAEYFVEPQTLLGKVRRGKVALHSHSIRDGLEFQRGKHYLGSMHCRECTVQVKDWLCADVDWSKAENGVLIAGAGIAGLATAAALHKVRGSRQSCTVKQCAVAQPASIQASTAEEGTAFSFQVGIPSLIVERDPGPRQEGSAIALWTNAFRALDALSVAVPLRDAHPLLQR